jgi:hypothetical protein
MIEVVIQNIVFSVLSIWILQSLWDYFKEKYTYKKTKDLVQFQTKKYREMLKEAQSQQTPTPPPPTEDDYISPEDKERMIQELMSFVHW